MAIRIANENFKIIEEVRDALMGFRKAIDGMFAGEDTMDELEMYHHPEFINRYGNVAANCESILCSRKEQLDSFVEIAGFYKQYGGGAMAIPWHKIFLRSPKEALVVFEICQAGPIFWDRSFVLHVWRKREDGQWQIYRMFTEQEGRIEPTIEQLYAKTNYISQKELFNAVKLQENMLNTCAIQKENENIEAHLDIHLDIKHIEMKNDVEGIVCYHRYLIDKEKIVDRKLFLEIWNKQKYGWMKSKCIYC
ncbi:hypothetical protein [Bacillus toyonensis]|uniref:hypothetical protein n=1 Tax=Bacillus toyonensis TaxID=155322 RepID=UPI000BF20620|nr:hypothetical protein [Bacillus toyonensis]PEM43184.1 hypothetical protein CN636_17170 [Bacillus toyonensis]